MEKTKFNLLDWFRKYSKKIMIGFFIVLIPIFILSIFIYQFDRDNKRFYFDKDGENPIYLSSKDLSKNKELNEYFDSFEIKLSRITKIYKDDKDDKEYKNGNFTFSVEYQLNSYYENSTVEMRWVLKTNFTDIQSTSRTINLTNNKGTSNMDYLFDIPESKFLIFKTKMPIAYFEIKVTKPSSLGESKTQILYYKVDTNKSKDYEVKE